MKQYYCFKVMVYGFELAVVIRLVRPFQAYLHERGIHVVGTACFRSAGRNIQWKKTAIKAEQQVRYWYLGVQLDTRKVEYKMPQDKEKNVLDGVNRE